ncbi:MAG: hypothetical protein IJE02_07485 [Clostridia bacterium]|nr:hypothetical protein [Clostridia bacterium]
MSIKTIEYKVNINGIVPATEQFGGMQGDHRVTMIEFVTDDLLNDTITDYADQINGKAMYRFDVYDGEGGIWSSESRELEYYTLSMELEERHTRHGGKVTIYLVMTVLSPDCETEIELYSFPAVLRLKNRPEGTYQDGENYESVTSLAEAAKSNALAAEKSNKELQAFASEIEKKLKNGEFDGVGVESAVIINDELIITYTDGTVQNLGNVKGDKGPQGEKGDKGDTPDVSGFVEKVKGNGFTYQVYAVGDLDNEYNDITLTVEDNGRFEAGADDGQIPSRQANGNLLTNEPIKDLDCANKKYVDDKIGDIDSAITELHNYAQALIGGNS